MEDQLSDILKGIPYDYRVQISRLDITITTGEYPNKKWGGLILSKSKSKTLFYAQPTFDSDDAVQIHLAKIIKACKDFDNDELRRAGALPPKPNETVL